MMPPLPPSQSRWVSQARYEREREREREGGGEGGWVGAGGWVVTICGSSTGGREVAGGGVGRDSRLCHMLRWHFAGGVCVFLVFGDRAGGWGGIGVGKEAKRQSQIWS